MTDAVNDDHPLMAQDLEDDSIRTFSNLVETTEFPFKGVKFRRVEVCRKPLNSICNPFCDGTIESLKLLGGGF